MKKSNIMFVIFFLILLGLSIPNFLNDKCNFLELRLLDVANIIITFFIATYIINSQSKDKKLANNFEYLINQIQAQISIDNIDRIIIFKSQETVVKSLLIHTKFVKNKFNTIYNYNSKLKFNNNKVKESLEKISKYIDDYDELITNNLYNISSDEIKKEIQRIANQIELECDKILLNLYL